VYTLGVAKEAGRPTTASTSITDLLRQHLRNDRLWKSFVQGDKAYGAHIKDRIALQRMTVFLLERKTGYQMTDKPNTPPTFLYSYTTGPAVYGVVLGMALGITSKSNLKDDIAADTQAGTVTYRNSILAEAPGNEVNCRHNILAAYSDLLKSPEIQKVKNSYEYLNEFTIKVRQAVEEISMLGYVPGNCNVCRRLGM